MPPELFTYYFFAEAWGWTPDQVDDLGLTVQEWLPRIKNAAFKAAKLRQKSGNGGGGGL